MKERGNDLTTTTIRISVEAREKLQLRATGNRRKMIDELDSLILDLNFNEPKEIAMILMEEK